MPSVPLREVASGIDAFYMTARCSDPSPILTRLEASRPEADAAPVDFDLGGTQFRLAPHGLNKYRFRLDHELLTLGVTPGKKLPTFFVQPRAEALHSLGVESVVALTASLFENEGLDIALAVSRVDLFIDVQDWALEADERHRFLCRADSRITHEESDLLTGFVFGKRKGKTITCRIYDKTLDAKLKGKLWWHDRWAKAGWNSDSQVLRIEFELQRNLLREMRLNSPTEVLENLAGLWAYATSEWLTFRTPTGDTTKSRWPVSPEWCALQQPSFTSVGVPLQRIRECEDKTSITRALPALIGYLALFTWLLGVGTLEQTLDRLPGLVRGYLHSRGRTYEDKVAESRRKRRWV